MRKHEWKKTCNKLLVIGFIPTFSYFMGHRFQGPTENG